MSSAQQSSTDESSREAPTVERTETGQYICPCCDHEAIFDNPDYLAEHLRVAHEVDDYDVAPFDWDDSIDHVYLAKQRGSGRKYHTNPDCPRLTRSEWVSQHPRDSIVHRSRYECCQTCEQDGVDDTGGGSTDSEIHAVLHAMSPEEAFDDDI